MHAKHLQVVLLHFDWMWTHFNDRLNIYDGQSTSATLLRENVYANSVNQVPHNIISSGYVQIHCRKANDGDNPLIDRATCRRTLVMFSGP